MSPRMKASRDLDVRGLKIPAGELFAVRSREVARLQAAGDAQPVNEAGQTSREAKRTRQSEKNATRKRTGRGG